MTVRADRCTAAGGPSLVSLQARRQSGRLLQTVPLLVIAAFMLAGSTASATTETSPGSVLVASASSPTGGGVC